MRQYLIDDLSREEQENITNYLKRKSRPAVMGGLFWIDVPEDLLSEEQRGHLDQCGPYSFAAEITKNSVAFEFLLRNNSNLHCSCIAYANREQRDFLLGFVDQMLSSEMIRA